MSARLDVPSDPELDPEAAERLVGRLRAEITEVDVESFRPATDAQAPEGVEGTDPVTPGAVIVALRDWLADPPHGTASQ